MGEAAQKYEDFIETPFEGWRIDPDKVRELSRLSPARAVFHIALEWTIVFATIYLSRRVANPILEIPAYLLAVVIIGSRQHALLLMMHEATHWRMFERKWLNDLVCEPFVTWPVLVSLRAFRHTHLQHHKYLNLPVDGDLQKKFADPDWHFPVPRGRLAWSLLRQFTGLGIWYAIKIMRYGNADPAASGQTPLYRATRIAYYICALALIIYFRVFLLFLAYWVVPLATCMIAFNKMRVLSEHPPIERATAYDTILEYQLGPIERILFEPKNCYYHIEHHSYPSVPFFNLPKLHRAMLANGKYYASLKPVTYWEMLRTLTV